MTGPKPDFGRPAPSDGDEFSAELPPNDQDSKYAPPGQYLAKVVDIIKSRAKSSGNPMWVVSFVIVEGEFAGLDKDVHLAITPNAMWKVTETMMALGLADASGGIINFKKTEVLNRGALIVLDDDMYRDRKTAKVTKVLPHPKGAGTLITGSGGKPSF
jgi:hypothetical protein